MEQRYRLLSLLADGRFHSGEELGAALGVGRSAIWKLIQSLEAYGLDVYAVRGRGYCLSSPIELLDRARIVAELKPRTESLLNTLEIFAEIDSTNRYLMERAGQGVAHPHACLAEYQSQGRGRRGRDWVSPFGTNVYMSVFHRFESPPEALQGLSLAVGVAATNALTALGVTGVGLKWPNDLIWQGRKLGGILLEMAGEPSGPWNAVVGIGLNLEVSESVGRRIHQPWADLHAAVGTNPGRNKAAGQLLHYVLEGLERFSREGFAPFHRAWEEYDVARDKPVIIHGATGATHGLARGVDETGAFLVSVDGAIRRFLSGDVSLRLAP